MSRVKDSYPSAEKGLGFKRLISSTSLKYHLEEGVHHY